MENTLSRLVAWVFPKKPYRPHRDIDDRLFTHLLWANPLTKVSLLMLGLLLATVGLLAPLLQKQAIDGLVVPSPNPQEVMGLFVLSFVALGFAAALNLGIRTLGAREGVRMVRWLSEKLYLQSLRLESEKHTQQTLGETVALLASHIQMVLFFMTEVFPSVFVSLVPLVVVPFWLYIFFHLNPIIICIVMVVFCGVCGVLAVRASYLFQQYKGYEAVRLGAINEWVQNIRALKALNWLDAFESKIEALAQQELRQRYKMVLNVSTMNSLSGITPYFLAIAGVVSLMFFKGQDLSPGDVFGVLWILGAFLIGPLRIAPWVIVIALDAATSLRRMEAYLTLPKQELPKQDEEAREGPKGPCIKVRNLNLAYGDSQVLQSISFDIGPGSLVAIVGPVGSGKTQLLQSLLGESPCRWDELEVGGVEMTPYDCRMSKFFGLVPQEPFAMSATLQENILFEYHSLSEKPDAQGVTHSLDLAEYGPDLATMSEGIATELGERGINLSGGQKQRLSLGRAHYLDRPVILLDDTLSALDEDTEKRIVHRLLMGRWRHKTRILVTHRLGILPHVDAIIFMENGGIIRQGSFDELKKLTRFQEFITSLGGEGQQHV